MIVAIDGPAGVGKSTIASLISEREGFFYLNSGNFYRALTYFLIEKAVDLESIKSILAAVKDDFNLELIDSHININGVFVDNELRSREVEEATPSVSSFPEVREFINRKLQGLSGTSDIVAEGRDMTTVVFPNAEIKVYLDAGVDVRAKRRYKQNKRDDNVNIIKNELNYRDKIDREKRVGGLKIADNALYLDTSLLTIEQVYQKICEAINEFRSK